MQGSSINKSDYRFTIEDNNATLGWDNIPVGSQTIKYSPYSVEELQLDLLNTKVIVAKFKVNRLMAGSKARLMVYDELIPDFPIVSIYLVDCLLQNYDWNYIPIGGVINNQSLLDRMNSYTLTLFTDGSPV